MRRPRRALPRRPASRSRGRRAACAGGLSPSERLATWATIVCGARCPSARNVSVTPIWCCSRSDAVACSRRTSRSNVVTSATASFASDGVRSVSATSSRAAARSGERRSGLGVRRPSTPWPPLSPGGVTVIGPFASPSSRGPNGAASGTASVAAAPLPGQPPPNPWLGDRSARLRAAAAASGLARQRTVRRSVHVTTTDVASTWMRRGHDDRVAARLLAQLSTTTTSYRNI